MPPPSWTSLPPLPHPTPLLKCVCYHSEAASQWDFAVCGRERNLELRLGYPVASKPFKPDPLGVQPRHQYFKASQVVLLVAKVEDHCCKGYASYLELEFILLGSSQALGSLTGNQKHTLCLLLWMQPRGLCTKLKLSWTHAGGGGWEGSWLLPPVFFWFSALPVFNTFCCLMWLCPWFDSSWPRCLLQLLVMIWSRSW